MQRIQATIAQIRLIATLTAVSVLLCGCFDLAQRVAIGRDGSGQYQLAITAQGLMGEALKDGDILQVRRGHVNNRTVIEDGNVTRTASVDFKSLDALTVPDEAIAVHVLGREWFGLGPTDAVFTRTFLVQNARRRGEARAGDDANNNAVIAGIFGNHTYAFSVTLPGSINWIAPVKIGNATVKPQVTGDFFQHTITWKMPLGLMLGRRMVRFEVGFSAYGTFGDAQSMPEGSSS